MDKLDKTVFVIGSLKQQEDIERIAAGYKKTYKNVLFVSEDPSKSIAEHIKECFDRIESADAVVAVKKPNNTFGEGVTYELEYAKRLNKTIIEILPDNDVFKKIDEISDVLTELDSRETSSNLLYEKYNACSWNELCEMGEKYFRELKA